MGESLMDEKEKALLMFKFMARSRALMEVLILNRQDIFGAFLSGLGMEGVGAGVMLALYEKDLFLKTPISNDHRTMWSSALALDEITDKGPDGHNHAYEIMKNHLCKLTSHNKGKDGNIHWGCMKCLLLPFLCSDMGRLFPVLVGMIEEIARYDSWRAMPKVKRPVGIAFFGEGADQQGVISETNTCLASANYRYPKKELAKFEKFLDPFARETGVLRGSPVVEIVDANQFSIFTRPEDEHGKSDLAKRALGYGSMIGIDVDGDDVEVMYKAAKLAIERAQECLMTRVIANTYRRTGHNEDQIRRDVNMVREAREEFTRGNWSYEPDWSRGKVQEVDPDEFKEQWKNEPLSRLRKKVVNSRLAQDGEFDAIMRCAREEMHELYKKAKAEPDITPEYVNKHCYLFPPYPNWGVAVEKPVKITEIRRLTYQEAYIETLRMLLASDASVSFFGQDVREGGVLVPTRKLAAEFGPRRVFNTPITEEATHSIMAGRSLVGGRPIVEVQQFAPFFADAFASMIAVVANNYFLKGIKFPFVNIFHCGEVRSGGSGPFHEEYVERYIAGMMGYMVVFPADAYDLVGLLRASYEFDGPVAFLLQISAATDPQFASEVPYDRYIIPLGKAKVKKEGSDFTVITYGASCVRAALNEAEYLEKEGISVEVIDLRTVWPYDLDTLRSSIAKTGRFAVMHADREDLGLGQSLIGALTSKENSIFYDLRARPRVIGAKNIPPSTAHSLVWDRLPYQVQDIEVRDEKGRAILRPRHYSPKLREVILESLQ